MNEPKQEENQEDITNKTTTIITNNNDDATSTREKKTITIKNKRKTIKIIISYIIIISFNLFLLIDSIHNKIFYNILKNQTNIIGAINDNDNDDIITNVLTIIGVSCILTVFKLPGMIYHPIIGYIFTISLNNMIIGILLSTLMLFIGICIGSIISYCIARYILPSILQNKNKEKSSLSSKDGRINEMRVAGENDISRQEQFMFLTLLRQSSIVPLSRYTINYQIGKNRFFSRIAFVSSFIGYMPGILVGVFFGCASATFLKEYDAPMINNVARLVLVCLGMIGMILGYTWIVILSKRHLAMFMSKLTTEKKENECNETFEDECNETCEDLHAHPTQEEEREIYNRDRFLLDMVSIYGYIEETEAVLEESRDDSASKSQLHVSSILGV